MKAYEKWALMRSYLKIVEDKESDLKLEALREWPDKGLRLAVDVGDETVGTVAMSTVTSGFWTIVDNGAFEPFAREHFDETVVEIEASMLPEDVIGELGERYPGSVRVHEVRCDWKALLQPTPVGPVLDTGELVPGVAWQETSTRKLLFTPDKKSGMTYGSVVEKAIDAIHSQLPGGEHGIRGGGYLDAPGGSADGDAGTAQG